MSRTTRELLEDNELCKLFIQFLFKKKVGFSVSRECRRHLSGTRIHLRSPLLKKDVEVSELIQGYKRSMSRTVVQTLDQHVDNVQRIATQWGASADWWKVNLATLIVLGFICIMRGD